MEFTHHSGPSPSLPLSFLSTQSATKKAQKGLTLLLHCCCTDFWPACNSQFSQDCFKDSFFAQYLLSEFFTIQMSHLLLAQHMTRCTETSLIIRNGNPNLASELPSSRGCWFTEPFTNNCALASSSQSQPGQIFAWVHYGENT